MLLASGIMFEVPIAMAALARMGVASAGLYRRQWSVALVGMAAIAAVLPGGDPISMVLLMLPQFVLYGVGIALAARFGQAPLWRRSDLDAV
jgi:sec-independent protein translocase protein TatC